MVSPPQDAPSLQSIREHLPELPLPLGLYREDGTPLVLTKAYATRLRQVRGDRPMDADLGELLGALERLDELQERLQSAPPGSYHPILLPSQAGGPAILFGQAARLDAGAILVHLSPPTAAGPPWARLLDSLPVGLLLANAESRLLVINSAGATLLDLNPTDFLGLPAETFFASLADRSRDPEVVLGSLREAAGAVDPAVVPVVNVELPGNPGVHLELSFFSTAEALGGQGAWGALMREVTQARDQVDWKLELLSLLAHDIRTPLATLKGHATALLANYRQWSDSMVLEFLEAMNRGTDELTRRVDRSLALTRLEAGRLGLRPVSVAPSSLIQGGRERAASALSDRPVQERLPPALPEVRVDPARIEEVLANLLERAARVSPRSAPIRLEGHSGETMVTLSVADEGPVIPPEEQDQLFEHPPPQPGAQARGDLALYISRKIIEAHGGRIWIESPPEGQGAGARLLFTLPILPDQPERTPEQPAAESRTTGARRALLIEPDPEYHSLIRAVLEEARIQLELAPDGPSALDRLAAFDPHLVILELSLPRMEGLAVARAIRRWSQAPILVLTSKTSPQDLVAAVDAGADDFLTKPFASNELRSRVEALLHKREQASTEGAPSLLGGDGLTIDERRMEVKLDGNPVDLTPTEFELLTYLARHEHQVLTHDQLIDHLWPSGQGSRHQLFVHINRLRAKIEPDPEEPRYVVTRWGVGYAFLPADRPGR